MNEKIILFSTETCPKCKVLKTKMDAKNIPYEVNMDVKYMRSLKIMSVPVLSVDGELMDFATANNWINDREV
mgnify:CR=1 FL=1